MREGLKSFIIYSKHSFVQYGTISDHHLSDNMSCVEIFKLKNFFSWSCIFFLPGLCLFFFFYHLFLFLFQSHSNVIQIKSKPGLLVTLTYNLQTLSLPWVTKTEFLLTMSTRWVLRIKKNINLWITSWSNTKFSELRW